MDEVIYIRVAYAALLFIFLFCGLLRCCNLWQFSGKSVAELYPARREAAVAYFAVLLLFPCVIHPLDASDTWLFARSFWILYIPGIASLAFKKFFFYEDGNRRKLLSHAVVAGLPAVVLSVLFIFACAGGCKLVSYEVIQYGVGVIGIFLAVYLLRITLWVYREAVLNRCNRYSDKNNFPKFFTFTLLGLLPMILLMAWITFIVGTPECHAGLAAVITLAGMGILIAILHPQWEKPPFAVAMNSEDATLQAVSRSDAVAVDLNEPAICCVEEDGMEEILEEEAVHEPFAGKINRKCSLSEAQLDSLERKIREMVETKKLYLDPNLKRKTLEEKLDINRSYLSEVFALRFGSFNRYLNYLRMEYAIQYAAEHPEAKQTEVALHSGFGSMNTYYRAKILYEAGMLWKRNR